MYANEGTMNAGVVPNAAQLLENNFIAVLENVVMLNTN